MTGSALLRGASTPEAIILEVVQEMNEDEKKTSQDQLDSEFANAVDAMAQVRRGAVVKGTITSADADFVYVDVHDKSGRQNCRREFWNQMLISISTRQLRIMLR